MRLPGGDPPLHSPWLYAPLTADKPPAGHVAQLCVRAQPMGIRGGGYEAVVADAHSTRGLERLLDFGSKRGHDDRGERGHRQIEHLHERSGLMSQRQALLVTLVQRLNLIRELARRVYEPRV